MNKEKAIDILESMCETAEAEEAIQVIKDELEPRPVVAIIGSEYCGPKDFAEALFDRYEIDALVIKDLTYAKIMTKNIDNCESKVMFIHLTMPTEKLADKIVKDHGIPYADALELAEDATFREQIVDFDNTTSDDQMILTYTGETDITIDKFIDICGKVIKKIDMEADDGTEGSALQDILS